MALNQLGKDSSETRRPLNEESQALALHTGDSGIHTQHDTVLQTAQTAHTANTAHTAHTPHTAHAADTAHAAHTAHTTWVPGANVALSIQTRD